MGWRQQVGGSASLLHGRSRKRSKSSNIYARSGNGMANGSNWTVVPYSGATSDEDSSVANRIRRYWEQLSANERQQILFVDEPDLVKQLYKLNLSLLCVGLMQRHLKMPLRSAVTKSASKMATTPRPTPSLAAIEDTPTAAPPTGDTPASTLTTENAVSKNASSIAEADPSAEKTYELLEAMEFMDIGTGILTVKSELVEDPGRLFSLVGEVLFGFVTTVHLLNEKQFLDLFVSESEVINTWEDYQRLIAMLVEQLILRSYVNYLEKQAAIQMEQLLLEVSLEDTKSCKNDQHKDDTSANKSKKKKKKKKKSVANAEEPPKVAYQPEPEEDVEEHGNENNPSGSNTVQKVDGDGTVHTAAVATTDCQEPEASPVKSLQPAKRPSILNPNALVFQPKVDVQMLETIPSHAHEKYIVRVDAHDAISDDEYGIEESDLDYSSEDDLGDDSAQSSSRWNQKRKREDDAELEWQLQQIYASTSTMLGWDFSRQCDVVVSQGAMPWDDSILWRTAPKEVVRYFTPGFDKVFAPYPPPQSYPFVSGGPALQPNNSRYFFSPPPPMDSLSSAGYFPGADGPSSHILPPRGHHPRTYAFQEADFRGVVTSPDFSSSTASAELRDRLPSPERPRHGM
uniref:Uncharacterized protein n=1 Tax=Globisporangium ultimum (strain ATCC 200006 / CBS 805.95 / DAOM BR144) TaxID=431595 RepID=K3WG94_GLOUD